MAEKTSQAQQKGSSQKEVQVVVPIQLEFVEDITVPDYTVFADDGKRRDYFGYKMEAGEVEGKLSDATKKGFILFQYLEIEKIWKVKRMNKTEVKNLKVKKAKQHAKIDCDESYGAKAESKGNEEYHIKIKIKIPGDPGYYDGWFAFKDENGNDVEVYDNKGKLIKDGLSVAAMVVPAKVRSPVTGPIYVPAPYPGEGTNIEQKLISAGLLKFSNWGVYYFNRNGNIRAGRDDRWANTHRYGDRFAWDVNGVFANEKGIQINNDWDKGKPVYPIDNGEIEFIQKSYGLIWIHHRFQEKEKETTGYYACYMHLEKIPEKWKSGSKVDVNNSLGVVGHKGVGLNHLHFAVYPVGSAGFKKYLKPFLKNFPYTNSSVYTEIEQI